MLAMVCRHCAPILTLGGIPLSGCSNVWWVKIVSALANFDFGFYFSLFRRRLPVFVTVLALATLVFVAILTFMPASYQATARILVESPQIPTDLAKSTVPTGAAEQFQIIQEDVLSRQNL